MFATRQGLECVYEFAKKVGLKHALMFHPLAVKYALYSLKGVSMSTREWKLFARLEQKMTSAQSRKFANDLRNIQMIFKLIIDDDHENNMEHRQVILRYIYSL